MDIKTIFLNGDLEEEIYTKNLKDFWFTHRRIRFVKSQYGLK